VVLGLVGAVTRSCSGGSLPLGQDRVMTNVSGSATVSIAVEPRRRDDV